MTTIIMLFILPLGIILFFYDKKLQRQNRETFEQYVTKIQNSDLGTEEKLQHIDTMYYDNGFKIDQRNANTLRACKKHFNPGLLFIFFGVASYFGPPLYIIYYHFILKPDCVTIDL